MSETVHNLPLTIRMECAIEDGKRYTTSDLRAVFEELRNKKELVTVYLGDDTFEDMCLVSFEPNKDTTRSGFDYSLEFKQVNIGFVDFQPVNMQPTLKAIKEDVSTTTVTTASGNASATMKNASATIKNASATIKNVSATSAINVPNLIDKAENDAVSQLVKINKGGIQKASIAYKLRVRALKKTGL